MEPSRRAGHPLVRSNRAGSVSDVPGGGERPTGGIANRRDAAARRTSLTLPALIGGAEEVRRRWS